MTSIFWFKKIEKMIESEEGGPHYDLNEKFAPTLQNLGFIEQKRWSENRAGFICSFSDFFVTDLGRKSYKEWKNELQR